MYGARPLAPYEAPELYSLLQRLAQRAHLPRMPIPHYIPSRIMNPFTMGKQANAAIGLTDGLLRRLTLRKLTGVLALADLVSRITHALSRWTIINFD